MTLLGLSAALFIIFVAGLGVTLIAARRQPALNLAEICALSWLLGTGVISLLLWGGGLFLSGSFLQGSVTVIALGLGRSASTW